MDKLLQDTVGPEKACIEHDRLTTLLTDCRKKPKHSKAQSTMPTSRDVRDIP